MPYSSYDVSCAVRAAVAAERERCATVIERHRKVAEDLLPSIGDLRGRGHLVGLIELLADLAKEVLADPQDTTSPSTTSSKD